MALNPKFKVGDDVKVIHSNKYPNIIGKVGKINFINCDPVYVSEPVYLIMGLSGLEEGYNLREGLIELYIGRSNVSKQQLKPTKIWNFSAGKPNFCVGCKKFNEYQEQAYVCFECENS